MKTSVAVIQKFHGFDLAQQLQDRQMLHRLYTSFYGRIGRKDNTKGYHLERHRVKTHPYFAFRQYFWKPRYFLLLYRSFGRWFAGQLDTEDAIISFGFQALPVLEKAQPKGIKVLIDRGAAHGRSQYKLLKEEYERHNLDFSALDQTFTQERFEQEQEEYEKADAILLPSTFAKETFLGQGIPESKIYLAHYGVDLQQFEPVDRRDTTFRIVYVGGINHQKGIPYLLEAVLQLGLPQMETWLIGPTSEAIRPLLKQHQDHCRLVGYISKHQLKDYLGQCDLFVFPSIQDGFGMVLAQGMACGLPVLTTTNTGGRDVITEGEEGFIVPIRDPAALAEKIQWAYHNREACWTMGQKALRRVQQGLSWEDYGQRIREHLQTVIAE